MAAGERLGAALRATTGRERPAIPSAARPAAPCNTCRREARARANDSMASRCFGSIVGFESIRVTFQLPPTPAWDSDSPPRQRVCDGAGHDPGRLPVPLAGLRHPLDGLEVGRVGELSGNPERVGQVKVANPE